MQKYVFEESLSIYCINPSFPGQNSSHFADDTFRCISVNENVRVLIKISQKFVPKDIIDKTSIGYDNG